MFSWQPIPGENWLMTHRHSLMLTSSMLLLSRERPKINVYSQSSVVYISVYSVNHVSFCVVVREILCILWPVYVSTMFPVFLEEVLDYPLSFPGLPTVEFLIACSMIKNCTVGSPGNKASCSLRLYFSPMGEVLCACHNVSHTYSYMLKVLAIESKACILEICLK